MSITHEQAHKLIQLNMEHMLNAQETARLSAHLRGCSECNAYAREINEVAKLLPALMKRQWSTQPAPLSISALAGSKEPIRTSALLTMRTVAISLVVIALFFSAWQFMLTGSASSPQLPLQVPPVPTPSTQPAQSTSTKITFENCEMIQYRVLESDSLESIAGQFSVSEAEIMEINRLKNEAVDSSMELLIPVCNFTPTGTFHAATFTTTFTPRIIATTSTPVDKH